MGCVKFHRHIKNYLIGAALVLIVLGITLQGITINQDINNQIAKSEYESALEDYEENNIFYSPEEVVQMVRIQIADRAIGISDETKKILFMRKSLTKTDRRGTGLGLTLVKYIITRYGGNIYARDRVPGNYREGTVFVLEIPRAVPLE